LRDTITGRPHRHSARSAISILAEELLRWAPSQARVRLRGQPSYEVSGRSLASTAGQDSGAAGPHATGASTLRGGLEGVRSPDHALLLRSAVHRPPLVSIQFRGRGLRTT